MDQQSTAKRARVARTSSSPAENQPPSRAFSRLSPARGGAGGGPGGHSSRACGIFLPISWQISHGEDLVAARLRRSVLTVRRPPARVHFGARLQSVASGRSCVVACARNCAHMTMVRMRDDEAIEALQLAGDEWEMVEQHGAHEALAVTKRGALVSIDLENAQMCQRQQGMAMPVSIAPGEGEIAAVHERPSDTLAVVDWRAKTRALVACARCRVKSLCFAKEALAENRILLCTQIVGAPFALDLRKVRSEVTLAKNAVVTFESACAREESTWNQFTMGYDAPRKRHGTPPVYLQSIGQGRVLSTSYSPLGQLHKMWSLSDGKELIDFLATGGKLSNMEIARPQVVSPLGARSSSGLRFYSAGNDASSFFEFSCNASLSQTDPVYPKFLFRGDGLEQIQCFTVSEFGESLVGFCNVNQWFSFSSN